MITKSLLSRFLLVIPALMAVPAVNAGSTDEIRGLLSENPFDAARLPAQQLCDLNIEARQSLGVSEQSLLCEALSGDIEAPEGMDSEREAYFEQVTDSVQRGIQILEEQEDYSSAEMNICKKILCAAAPGGPENIKDCEDDSGPTDIIVAITRGKRPRCPMVQW